MHIPQSQPFHSFHPIFSKCLALFQYIACYLLVSTQTWITCVDQFQAWRRSQTVDRCSSLLPHRLCCGMEKEDSTICLETVLSWRHLYQYWSIMSAHTICSRYPKRQFWYHIYIWELSQAACTILDTCVVSVISWSSWSWQW